MEVRRPATPGPVPRRAFVRGSTGVWFDAAHHERIEGKAVRPYGMTCPTSSLSMNRHVSSYRCSLPSQVRKLPPSVTGGSPAST